MEKLSIDGFKNRLRRTMWLGPIIFIVFFCIFSFIGIFLANYMTTYDFLEEKSLESDVEYYMNKYNPGGDDTVNFMSNVIKEIANENNISDYNDLGAEETIKLFLQKNEDGINNIKDSWFSVYSKTYSCYKGIFNLEYWASDFLYTRHVNKNSDLIRKYSIIIALEDMTVLEFFPLLGAMLLVFIPWCILWILLYIIILHNDKIFNKYYGGYLKKYTWREKHKSLRLIILVVIWTLWALVIILPITEILLFYPGEIRFLFSCLSIL